MLWTDSLFISVNDLTRVDSEVPSVATAEGITLTGNYGTIRGAIEEAGQEMSKMVVAFGGFLSSGDISPNHISAVLNIGLGNSVRYKALLSQIIVSGADQYTWNHVKEWAIHFCLQYFYRNAYNRSVKDRYEGKMRYYKSELDRRIRPGLFGLGLHLIIQPLAAPAAIFERSPVDYLGSLVNQFGNVAWTGTGAWGDANLTAVATTEAEGGDFDVAVTYVNQGVADSQGGYRPDYTKYISSSQNGNAESNPSTIATILAVPNDSSILVDISSLNPPNGTQDPRSRLQCVIWPLAATGWNVYAGPKGGVLTLQNASPISIFTKTHQLPSDPTTTGVAAGAGQYTDRIMSMAPTRQRA